MTDHLATTTLIDYLHHELSPADDARVYSHLATCDQCARELDAERTLSDALRAGAQRETLELPSLVKAEIWERVRASDSRPGWLAALLRPIVAFPAAAAILLAAAVSLPAFMHANAPAIDAAYYLQQHASSRTNPLLDRGSQQSTVLLEESDEASPASFAALITLSQPQSPVDR